MVKPYQDSPGTCLRELSNAQRGWEALLREVAEEDAPLPVRSQETLLNFLDLGLVLIRTIQAARRGGREHSGGRAEGEAWPQEEEKQMPQQLLPPPPPLTLAAPPPEPPQPQPRNQGFQNPTQKAFPSFRGRPRRETQEEQASLGALRKKVDALQKEVEALPPGQALPSRVRDLHGKGASLAFELDDFISKKIWALGQEAEVLWEAWCRGNLPLGLLGALKMALPRFLWDSPLQKKMSALGKMAALRERVPEAGGPPLGREALWKKVTELNFALWEVQLDRAVAFREAVDGCSEALRGAPQGGADALRVTLEVTQDVLRAAPLEELAALHKITGALLDTMVNFPGAAPPRDEQEALWRALRGVPLKEMADLWERVRTLWDIPPKMCAVWEKVRHLESFLCDDSQRRVRNFQENVEALKDALRQAVQEEAAEAAEPLRDHLLALWQAMQGFIPGKLVALENKLNILEERLEAAWNAAGENLPPLKETVGASHKKPARPLHIGAPQEELSDLPESEMDALQSNPLEEVTEAGTSAFWEVWKNPSSDWPVSMPKVPVPMSYTSIPQEAFQWNPMSPGNAHLQPWEAPPVNHPIPLKDVACCSMGQDPNAAFPNCVDNMLGLQNCQLPCALATRPPLQPPVLPLLATDDHQQQPALGISPPQPTVSPQQPTPVSSFGIASAPTAHSAPDVGQMQSTPEEQTRKSPAGLNHNAASDAKGALPESILAAALISPGPWRSSHGTLSETRPEDLPAPEHTISLNANHEISAASSHHGSPKGQNTQETEEPACEDVWGSPHASNDGPVPGLANSEPPCKKQKMDALHSSQMLALDREMVNEYKKYRNYVLAILNQYKSTMGKLRTRLKQSPDQTNALTYTEEAKALASTLRKERALLKWFDCFRDLHKSKDDP